MFRDYCGLGSSQGLSTIKSRSGRRTDEWDQNHDHPVPMALGCSLTSKDRLDGMGGLSLWACGSALEGGGGNIIGLTWNIVTLQHEQSEEKETIGDEVRKLDDGLDAAYKLHKSYPTCIDMTRKYKFKRNADRR